MTDKIRKFFLDFFLAPGSGLNLSLFRVVVFSCLFLSIDNDTLTRFLSLEREFMVGRPGLLLEPSWVLPLSDSISLLWIFKAACLLAVVGLFSQVSALLATLGGFYLLAIPHLYGGISHGYQHLIWFGLLLAASPCGDVLSVDAYLAAKKNGRKSRCGDRHSIAYTPGVRIAWILFGMIYFFPGLKKALSGFDWFFAENMRATVLIARRGDLTSSAWATWIFDQPLVASVIPISVVLFEITFLFGIFFNRLRSIYLALGLVFQGLVFLVLGFPFYYLMACYAVFVDWSRLFRLSSDKSPTGTSRPIEKYRMSMAIGLVLICVNGYFGFNGIWGWPFTAYPSFHRIYKDGAQRTDFNISAYDLENKEIPIKSELDQLIARFGPYRWDQRQQDHFLKRSSEIRIREIQLIWRELTKTNPDLQRVSYLRLKKYVRTSHSFSSEPIFDVDRNTWTVIKDYSNPPSK